MHFVVEVESKVNVIWIDLSWLELLLKAFLLLENKKKLTSKIGVLQTGKIYVMTCQLNVWILVPQEAYNLEEKEREVGLLLSNIGFKGKKIASLGPIAYLARTPSLVNLT